MAKIVIIMELPLNLQTELSNVDSRHDSLNHAVTQTGLYLLCYFRNSDKIQVFCRGIQTGLLTDTYKDISVSKAICIQF